MKRILITLAVLSVAGTLCFAADTATTATKPAMAPAAPAMAQAAKMVQGKVDSVSLADPAKGSKSEIVVVDDAGAKVQVLVKPTTTIYGTNYQAITLDKIKKDDKASVKYETTKEGVNQALSISLVK